MNSSIYDKLINKEAKLGVIGLGYVGLPLPRQVPTPPALATSNDDSSSGDSDSDSQ